MFIKPQKFISAFGIAIEGTNLNLFRLGISRDPFREAHAVRQRGESLRRLPFDNDIFARQCFAMRRNDQGHECRKNREFFHFRAPFWLKTPLKRSARHCFLKLTRNPPQRIGPRLRRSLFISMTGVLSNGKIWVSPRRPREDRDRRHRCGVEPGGFRRKTIKSHEAHASLLSATLAPARLLISNPLALSDINSTLTFGAN